MRDAELLQPAQHDLQRRQLLLVGLGHHDGGVDRAATRLALVVELDRPGQSRKV